MTSEGNNTRKEQPKKGMGDLVFTIGLVFVLSLCIPFIYYAILAYQWGMENKPPKYQYPEKKYFLVTFMGLMYFAF